MYARRCELLKTHPQGIGQLSMNDSGHILMVDDDPEICAIVKEYLGAEGYRVSVAHDGSGMRGIIDQSPADLILLDLKLPDENGLTLARTLRAENSDAGIIIVTGRGETIDRIVGLELGADDYLPKPFHLRELLARVKSVLRRNAPLVAKTPPSKRSLAEFEGWRLDMSARELISPAGEEVRLTTGEFDLLVAFVTNANRVLSRDRLLEMTRGRAVGPYERTIDVQVGRLRRKLGDKRQQSRLIKTVRGTGYIFAATVNAYSGEDEISIVSQH
jgi:two-component system, OmpR family, response regulator